MFPDRTAAPTPRCPPHPRDSRTPAASTRPNQRSPDQPRRPGSAPSCGGLLTTAAGRRGLGPTANKPDNTSMVRPPARSAGDQGNEDVVHDLTQDVVGDGLEGHQHFVAEQVEGETDDPGGEPRWLVNASRSSAGVGPFWL